jgi:hypothetical protein
LRHTSTVPPGLGPPALPLLGAEHLLPSICTSCPLYAPRALYMRLVPSICASCPLYAPPALYMRLVPSICASCPLYAPPALYMRLLPSICASCPLYAPPALYMRCSALLCNYFAHARPGPLLPSACGPDPSCPASRFERCETLCSLLGQPFPYPPIRPQFKVDGEPEPCCFTEAAARGVHGLYVVFVCGQSTLHYPCCCFTEAAARGVDGLYLVLYLVLSCTAFIWSFLLSDSKSMVNRNLAVLQRRRRAAWTRLGSASASRCPRRSTSAAARWRRVIQISAVLAVRDICRARR